MKDKNTYFNRKGQENFIDIFLKDDIKKGANFKRHWHEHLQIYYFIDGIAYLECGLDNFKVVPGNIVIANSNELHYLESLSDNLKFYSIRIEPTFLFSNQVDLLQTKYLAPLALNHIVFNNLIQNDSLILKCITTILDEYHNKEVGYELSIKANIYQLIVLLLRSHIDKIYSEDEFIKRKYSLEKFECIFDLIEEKYMDKITLKELASHVNLSAHHFCRTFKQITGKTTIDFINGIRLDKDIYYLKETDLNMTEIAMRCGFDSINYFSRLFKRNYNISPTKYRNEHKEVSNVILKEDMK
ncbi:AraC family transcriptional regulator [Clostridioides difficile]|uniref:AraC family transcriptional regulator n=1 Tax=Clostridioides difficile TaxID=1496 RepID=UPI0029C4DAC6|nr:AraC family transcriptional regulator [Clostridioides difficile]MDX5750490.1 AraC family transcriptional regulator [Clostridioides difficile]